MNAVSYIAEVKELRIDYGHGSSAVHAVQGASLAIRAGQTVGIVGESGSGKSTVARALLGLLPPDTARVTGGSIHIAGADVTRFLPRQWRKLRGNPVAMIFQDPLTFLNPVMTVGRQIGESLRAHQHGNAKTARVADYLEMVKLSPEFARSYPDELSGGMRQRVLLAVALACQPKLLVADEPTTALDVTTQAEIMALLRDLQQELGMAMLMISHDLGLISSSCEDVYVMYGGRTIEWGPSLNVLGSPAHPYSRGLLAASEGERDARGFFVTIPGDVPDLRIKSDRCPFSPRCTLATGICATLPEPQNFGGSHQVRCHHLSPPSRETQARP